MSSLRDFRRKAGLTQIELAAKSGLPLEAISALEDEESELHSGSILSLAALDTDPEPMPPAAEWSKAPDDRGMEAGAIPKMVNAQPSPEKREKVQPPPPPVAVRARSATPPAPSARTSSESASASDSDRPSRSSGSSEEGPISGRNRSERRDLHAWAEAELRRQRAAATATSMVIAILSVVLIGVVLALFLIPSLITMSPTLVTYDGSRIEEERLDPRLLNTQVQRQPSAPNSSMARVVASTSPSPVAVPVPEVTQDPSLEFGMGDDFGAGWGDGDGSGSGGTSFFGQAVRAERIAYVIDYSSSMGSQGRVELMRRELAKSLGQITHGTRYGLVCFSCVAWEMGDRVRLDRNGGTAVVTGEGGRRYEWKDGGGKQGWKPAGGIPQRADWLVASKGQLDKSKNVVKSAPLSSGTSWDKGLDMALSMNPPPQVIYFMTDGVASGSGAWAREYGAKARAKGVRINCIAMMEPKAHADMNELAKLSGGQFTIVSKNGTHKRVR